MTDRWFYGWNVVALTLVNQAVSVGICIYSFALFVVPWLDEFGVSRSEVMFAAVAMQVGVGLGLVFVIYLLAKWLNLTLLLGLMSSLVTSIILVVVTGVALSRVR